MPQMATADDRERLALGWRMLGERNFTPDSRRQLHDRGAPGATSSGWVMTLSYRSRRPLAFASWSGTRGHRRPARAPSIACDYPSALSSGADLSAASRRPRLPVAFRRRHRRLPVQHARRRHRQRGRCSKQYLPAAREFSGPVYAAMGNHECSGFTDSNCTPGGPLPCDSRDACGITENLSAFESGSWARWASPAPRRITWSGSQSQEGSRPSSSSPHRTPGTPPRQPG